ncbi:MAG: hypothetical protein GY823_13155 [Flavobacteriaceae bacterium]|nr:hypothetical protein [Flavobacteriaceae bacterium]
MNIHNEYHDHRDNRTKTLKISQKELLLRLLSHILDKFFKMIRYFGFLSNRVRSKLLPIIYEKLEQKLSVLKPLTYGAMLKKMLGVDPYECILCGSKMKLKSKQTGMNLQALKINLKNLVLQKPI